VDEFGHRLELIDTQLTVRVLIKLFEHLFRLGHRGRAAGAGWLLALRTFVGRLVRLLLFLGGRDSKLADLAAGGFALCVAELAIAVFVELLENLFLHAGVRIVALLAVLFGLGQGWNRQEHGGHENQTRDQIPHVSSDAFPRVSCRSVIAPNQCSPPTTGNEKTHRNYCRLWPATV
jgi:hypothetical protein